MNLPPQEKSSRLSTGCLVVIGVLGGAVIVAATIVALALRGFGDVVERNNPISAVGTLTAPSTPTIVVRPPALLQVRALNDLATAQMLLSTIVEADQARVGNVLYERLVLIACGRVKAGIDLAQLREEDVRVEGDTVTVRLPKAKLLDTYLIDDSSQPCNTKVYDRTNLVLLPAGKDLESQAREKAVIALRETAVQSGILSEANKNARVAIERILLLAGYKQIVFVDE
jgi:hypothetical protein